MIVGLQTSPAGEVYLVDRLAHASVLGHQGFRETTSGIDQPLKATCAGRAMVSLLIDSISSRLSLDDAIERRFRNLCVRARPSEGSGTSIRRILRVLERVQNTFDKWPLSEVNGVD